MNELLIHIVNTYGTPVFVYQLDAVQTRIADAREIFGNRFSLSYAVKSNPNPTILQRLKNQVEILDISSGGELVKAIAVGWSPERLSFTGPGKHDAELQAAIEHRIGWVIIESVHEANRLNRFAEQAGIIQPILIRINPMKLPRGFGVNMAGKPSQFGIDEEEINQAIESIIQLRHLRLCGFHIYSGTQCLRSEAIVENYQIFIDIFSRVCETHQLKPEKLIFGSGLGIPYHENDQPIELKTIAEHINPALDVLRTQPRFAQTDFVLEVGRYFIGEAGLYLTRVINKKSSRGATICICDGGMNHHLGACGHLGSVIHRNYQMFKVINQETEQLATLQPYELFGPLCTSIDRLGHSVQFPGLNIGDTIAIRCSGAYGPTASPVYFISHEPPKEILVETINGVLNIQDISHIPHQVDNIH
ncbi:MAG: type III PLP-dependent enzyme [Pseudomonadota bacterium]|nr:type III PLP-dependent enzyme [Pseudomonadota bacterium]